jgi:hypothetical protein
MVLPTFRVSLSSSVAFPNVNTLWKHSHRHTQKCALLNSNTSLDSGKLTVLINHHLFHLGIGCSVASTKG